MLNKVCLGVMTTKTYYDTDLRSLALSAKIEEAPGKRFHYNNYNPLLLGIILERTTHKHVSQYLEEKIWKPLGMEAPGSWSLDSDASGFEKMESGINARAIDFARIGRLFLNNGNWNGKQIISEKWVNESTRPDTTTESCSILSVYVVGRHHHCYIVIIERHQSP